MLDLGHTDTENENPGDATEQHHHAPPPLDPNKKDDGDVDVASGGVTDEIAEALEKKVLSDAEFLVEMEQNARGFNVEDEDDDLDDLDEGKCLKEPDSERPYFTFFVVLLLASHQVDNMMRTNCIPQSLSSNDEDAIKERYDMAFELILRRGLIKLGERFPDKNAFQVIEEINQDSFVEGLITIIAMGLWKEKKHLQKLCERELPDEYQMRTPEENGEDEYGLFKGKDLNFELDFSLDKPPVDILNMLKQLMVLILQKRAEKVLLAG